MSSVTFRFFFEVWLARLHALFFFFLQVILNYVTSRGCHILKRCRRSGTGMNGNSTVAPQVKLIYFR